MIDTIVIKIRGLFRFKFLPSCLFGQEFKSRSFRDLTKEEIVASRIRPQLRSIELVKGRRDIYLPRVWIHEIADPEEQTITYILRIQFSAPKLLFANNFQEPAESHLDRLISILQKRLEMCGVLIEPKILREAAPTAAHFGKNILLPKHIRMHDIIDELSRTSFGKTYEVTKTQYKDGETLQLFNLVQEFCFYDKISDLKKSAYKQFDKSGDPEGNGSFVKQLGLSDKECFRFERRFKNEPTLRREVNRLLGRDEKAPLTISDLFSEDLWKKIVLGSWKELIGKPSNKLALFSVAVDDVKLFTHILEKAKAKNQRPHSQNKMYMAYFFANAIKHNGVKVVKNELTKIWTGKPNERLNERIEEALTFLNDLSYSNSILYLDKELERFERIDIDNMKA